MRPPKYEIRRNISQAKSSYFKKLQLSCSEFLVLCLTNKKNSGEYHSLQGSSFQVMRGGFSSSSFLQGVKVVWQTSFPSSFLLRYYPPPLRKEVSTQRGRREEGSRGEKHVFAKILPLGETYIQDKDIDKKTHEIQWSFLLNPIVKAKNHDNWGETEISTTKETLSQTPMTGSECMGGRSICYITTTIDMLSSPISHI